MIVIVIPTARAMPCSTRRPAIDLPLMPRRCECRLPNWGPGSLKSYLYGRAFEHFIIIEVRAYNAYRRCHWELGFWRTKHGDEVDLIIDERVAIEIKATQRLNNRDLNGLKKTSIEAPWQKRILVSQDPLERKYPGDLWLMPWEIFLERLWAGEI